MNVILQMILTLIIAILATIHLLVIKKKGSTACVVLGIVIIILCIARVIIPTSPINLVCIVLLAAIEGAIVELNNNRKNKVNWIPVEWKLPICYLNKGENVSPVIVTFLSYHEKGPRVDDLAVYDEGKEVWRWYEQSSTLAEMAEILVPVTAWMPLPKPYKKTDK